MVDITSKSSTLRTAIAEATVEVSSDNTIQAIREKTVPKGDVFEMSKAAGLLGIKQTPYLLPDCHPLPIESAKISYEIEGLKIFIRCEVKTIYKTGVEVEAMHGASVVALNMYDMLKPIDKGVKIENIHLVEKRGGKSDYKNKYLKAGSLKGGVIVCSDTISAGQKEDKAGKAIAEKLESFEVEIGTYEVIPDEATQIEATLKRCLEENYNLVIFTGGTGLSNRDVTPETLIPLIERRIPGMEEAIRKYGQDRMPYAMLSRSVAGLIGSTLVLALPGSTNGAKESMDAIFPEALHLFNVVSGARHD